MTCASTPPSIPSGMVPPLYARTAMSSIGAPCSGSPFTYQQPFSQARCSGRVHAQVRAGVHRQAEDVHVLTRPGAHALGEERDADPHQLPARTLLGLLAPQLVVA